MMTQIQAIRTLKFRVKKLKEETAKLVEENQELNEVITSIYETAAGFSLAKREDFEGLDLDDE